ncbi:MAG TPA: BON domain-containing protein [Pyrinomonadaceae bacterium]|nr:BON domain-containing protein [Pyrinomonadaceae bacterium]
MISLRNYLAVAIAIFGLSLGSVYAQGSTSKGSDRTIEQNVERQILRLPRYEVFDYIGYKVEGSTVTLFGQVRNAINKSDARNRVADIQGVTQVIDNIVVLPLGRFDDTIRVNLYRQIANYGGLSRYLHPVNPSVRLVVNRGHISLEGFVSNRGDYNTMQIVASGIPGTFSVTNNLVIDGGRAG